MQNIQEMLSVIIHAIQRRCPIDENAQALRLFNGFYEGIPGLVIDKYSHTLVIFNHTESGMQTGLVDAAAGWAMEYLEGVDSVLLKQRRHPDGEVKNGILIAGGSLPEAITESGVRYAIDLQMNQDAGFYLDTRELRCWLLAHSEGKRVLNTFACTGSLGAAAGAGGAAQVIQTDLNRRSLEFARQSWALNDLEAGKHEIIPGDFFRVTARLRRAKRLFDCVILDPPFFSTTDAGRVDLEAGMARLVNKVRPLAAHEGVLVAINNALFLSGADFKAELYRLCQSEYLSFEAILPVPQDVTGYPETIVEQPPIDPAPFNHPTKIALLRVSRKDGRR